MENLILALLCYNKEKLLKRNMRLIDQNKFTEKDNEIYQYISALSKAELKNVTLKKITLNCHISDSKVTKFFQKNGFTGLKDFQDFTIIKRETNDERNHLLDFLNTINYDVLKKVQTLILKYEKIIFYAKGPTLNCAEYFTNRLRYVTGTDFLATSESNLVKKEANQKSLVIILTVSGTYFNIDEIVQVCNDQGSASLIIIEEMNDLTIFNQTKTLYLTNTTQKQRPNESFLKSRSVFYCFFEILIQDMQDQN